MREAEKPYQLAEHAFPGRLVVIDGTDGAGKSTIIAGLRQHLTDRGHRVLVTRQPTTEGRGLAAFRTYVFEPERRDEVDYRALLCMMIGDRLQHIHQVIRPALASGQIVLCDRYIFTQLVTTRTRGFSNEPWMQELIGHVIRPDTGILLDLPLEVACRRISSRTDWHESFLERNHVAANLLEFRNVARAYGLDIIDTSDPDPELAIGQAIMSVDKCLGE